MSKGSWVVVLIFLTTVFMISLWTIDISVSVMNFSSDAKVTNGFWIRNPTQTYHIAIWLAVVSFFTTATIAVKVLLGDES